MILLHNCTWQKNTYILVQKKKKPTPPSKDGTWGFWSKNSGSPWREFAVKICWWNYYTTQYLLMFFIILAKKLIVGQFGSISMFFYSFLKFWETDKLVKKYFRKCHVYYGLYMKPIESFKKENRGTYFDFKLAICLQRFSRSKICTLPDFSKSTYK